MKMRFTLFSAIAAIYILLFFMIPLAYAAPDVAPVSLSDQEIDARLKEVTQSIQLQEKNASYWEYGWGAFNGGSMIWSAVQASQDKNRHVRNTDIVEAAESLIGITDVMFRPLPAFHADAVCNEPDGPEKNRLQCLAARETLLESSAERANEPYEILPHAGNAGFNLLAGLIIWRVGGAGRALASAIPGELIGELQLWTTPQQPIDDFDQYKMRFSPLLIETQRSRNPTTGVMFSLAF